MENPPAITPIHVMEIDLERGEVDQKYSGNSSMKNRIILRKFVSKIFQNMSSKRTLMEISLCFCIVVVAFSLSTTTFLRQSIQTLVPFGSTDQCDSYSEVYNLAKQSVEVSYPVVLKFIDYNGGLMNPAMAHSIFTASWSSCRQEAYNVGDFGLSPANSNISFLPLNVPINGSASGSYGDTVTSNNDCFRLSCGFSYFYTNIHDRDLRTYSLDLTDYLNNTLIWIVPYTDNLIDTIDNGTILVGNSQIMTSISVTNTSVSATCAVSIVGDIIFILQEANTIANSGTYLCITYTNWFQAVSSALSVSLTVLGVCKSYFWLKRFFVHK